MNSLGRNTGNKKNKILTPETWGMILILFSVILLVALITREIIFGKLGEYINSFLLGLFGYTAYGVLLGTLYAGICLVVGKSIQAGKALSALLVSFLVSIVCIIHVYTTSGFALKGFGGYLAGCYNAADSGISSSSAGGLMLGIIVYPVIKLTTNIGGYIVFSLLTVLLGLGIYKKAKSDNATAGRPAKAFSKEEGGVLTRLPDGILGFKQYPTEGYDFAAGDESVSASRELYTGNSDFEFKTKKELRNPGKNKSEKLKILYPNYGSNDQLEFKNNIDTNKTYSQNYQEDLNEKLRYIKTPPKVVPSEITARREVRPVQNPVFQEPERRISRAEEPARRLQESHTERILEEPVKRMTDIPPKTVSPDEYVSRVEINEDILPKSNIPMFNHDKKIEKPQEEMKKAVNFDIGEADEDILPVKPIKSMEPKIVKPKPQSPPASVRYNAPPIALLEDYFDENGDFQDEINENTKILEETLYCFDVPATVQSVVRGPAFTRYELSLPSNISVKRVPPHADDMAMRLQAKDGIRIEAPIPGKDLVGIEVANKHRSVVGLKDIMMSKNYKNSGPDSLTFALGLDISGEGVVCDITEMPHLLVAGSTGMGKSVCLSTMIISLICKYSPDDLRLILVDPKQVEFSMFKNLPHLLIAEPITEVTKAITLFNWAVDEMERRFATFKQAEVKNIDEYNQVIDRAVTRKMPKIVIIVDELNDLMIKNKKPMEDVIMKIAQKARAAGLHLVLATQRPSVDVITGVIKANLPSRVAFRVTNYQDSTTILGEAGAENLLGRGDLLYKDARMQKPIRLQGPYSSVKEIKEIVNYIKENNTAYFDEAVAQLLSRSNQPESGFDADEDDEHVSSGSGDELFKEALRHVIVAGSASISMIQRKFSLGYAKAGKVIDKMESMGYISAFDGSKSRQVMITMDEFNDKFGD